jgi:DtxR family Mn-dependent transcriptional regulator
MNCWVTPLFDPHGDPIPDRRGNMRGRCFISLDKAIPKKRLSHHSRQRPQREIHPLHGQTGHKPRGDHIEVVEVEEYDGSMSVIINGNRESLINKAVAENIFTTSEIHCCAFEKNYQNPPCLAH